MSPGPRARVRRPLIWTSVIAVPLLAGAAIAVPMAASGAVDLPDKTPQELIAFAGASDVKALSGTIEQKSELGLPDIGALTRSMDDAGDGASSAQVEDLISLVTGSHTAKVYLDGDNARLQVLDRLGERNVYIDGAAREVWYVDSESQSATKLMLPDEEELRDAYGEAAAPAEPGDPLPTPDEMLDQALARLDDSTEVTVGTDARVAGREVYELILAPRTDDTLVGDVRFAIDGETGVALAASVSARGAADPAFQIAFTQVDFSAPDAGVFAFEPGTDIAVTEKDVPLPSPDERDAPSTEDAAEAPSVIGEGWSAVVELPNAGMDAEQRAMLDSVTTAVEGGRVLQTSLMTVMITDDGRVLVGAVPTQRLIDVAAR
ncbi:hypothetical protein FBY40_3153 [Microbacterium sp. SLBN-154]|uniref:DUF2092 domain-containing protein n=1 Tax=Microbacterium sp. SLBN-154 TaxID=2768458 RepID=UPI0011540FAD|nr:DUF2092 domain-containing protein [Microbacterium sp. SLBN-154]TQK20615.1 hypothetical protein FBY40_3153 [Microbacterium sp. SLBN-154]